MHISRNRSAGIVALLLIGGIATANAAGELYVSSPQAAIAVAPGGTVPVVLHIENVADEVSDATTVEVRKEIGYTFATSGAAGCGAVHDVTNPDVVAFDLPSLAAGATLDCTLAVTRSGEGIDDLQLGIDSPIVFRAPDVILGTFADIALRNERVSYSVDESGVVHGVFRVIAKNIGNVPVGAFNAATCSHESTFNYSIGVGCTPTTSTCARGMLPYRAQGALLPPLAPGEETSCLVEVTRPTPQPYVDTLHLDQDPYWDVWLIDTSTGGKVYDAEGANNDTELSVPAAPEAGATAASTLSPFAAGLLGVGLLGVAWVSRRRFAMRRTEAPGKR